MSDLLIFIIITLTSYFCVVGASMLGRTALTAYIVGMLPIMVLVYGKVSTILGFSSVVAVGGYMSLYLASDILTEKYGKIFARKAVFLGMGVLILYSFFLYLMNQASSIEDTEYYSEALNALQGGSWRIAVATIVGYAIAQNFDVLFYHRLKEWTSGRFLWLRNNLSTYVSSLMDNIIFYSIAFAGLYADWWQWALVSYVFCIVCAAIDTPFIYAAKKVAKNEA